MAEERFMAARIKTIFQRARNHELVRVVSGMMVLTLIGQGLYVLAGPFIGRLYSPEEVGYFGLFVTVSAALGVFACGLYDLAIPAVRDDEQARNLGGVCMAFSFGLATIGGIGFTLATAIPALGLGDLPAWSGVMMAIAIATQGWVLVGQAWAIRHNEVRAIGQGHVLMNGTRSALQVLGGVVLPFWFILVAGELIARIAQAFCFNVTRMLGAKAKFKPKQMKTSVIEHRRFPMVFGPAFFLDSMSTLLQTGMIGALFGALEMGPYFLMRRTLDLPVAFAFRSLSDAFFAKQLALAKQAPEQLTHFFLKMSGLLAMVGIGVSWPLFVWGAELFKLFYGPDWALAGELAAIMVLPIILNLAVAPVARVFQLSNWSQLRLIPSGINIIGTLILLQIATSCDLQFQQVIIGISIVTAALYVSYFFSGIIASKHIIFE